MSSLRSPTIEPIGGDLLTIARCIVLDVDTFPHPSIPFDLTARNRAARVWVARDEARRVVGFVATVARREIEIVGLAVDRAERRRGVGRALLVEAMAAEDDAAPLVLHVSPTNTPALALYRASGFVTRRRLVGYYARSAYGGRGDALEMVWSGRVPA